MKKVFITFVALVLTFCACFCLSSCNVLSKSNSPSITKIEIESQPIKTEYQVGEDFCIDGLVVKAIYSNGTSEYLQLDKVSVTGFDSQNANDNVEVVVSYQKQSVSFFVSVSDVIKIFNVTSTDELANALAIDGADINFLQNIDAESINLHADNVVNIQMNGNSLVCNSFALQSDNEGEIELADGNITATNGDIQIDAPNASLNVENVDFVLNSNKKVSFSTMSGSLDGYLNVYDLTIGTLGAFWIADDSHINIVSTIKNSINLQLQGKSLIENNSQISGNQITVDENAVGNITIKNYGKLDSLTINSADANVTLYNYLDSEIPTILGDFAQNTIVYNQVETDLAGGENLDDVPLSQWIEYGHSYALPRTSATGFVFDGYSPSSATNIVEPTKFVAKWKELFDITATATAGGSITFEGSKTYVEGSSATYEFAPSTGYRISKVLIDGQNNETAVATGTYTFENIASDSTISVEFALKKHTIRFENYNGDLLQSSDFDHNTLPIYSGQTPTKQATAEFNYQFSGWDKEIVVATESTTYKAKFVENTNQYTVNFVDAKDVYSGDDSITQNYGTQIQLQNLSKAKFSFAGWKSQNTQQILTENYTITANDTLTAVWETLYTMTLQSGQNSQITYSGTSLEVLEGEDFDFAVTVDEAYDQTTPVVKVDGNVLAGNFDGEKYNYSLTNISKDCTISVENITTKNIYQITPTASNGGIISPNVVLNVRHGQRQSIAFAPNEGYVISKVLIDNIQNDDAMANQMYTFANISKSHTIYVEFAQAQVSTEGLEYTLIENTETMEVALGSATDTEIVIAESYDGKEVVQVKRGAFKDSDATSIVLPDSIQTIVLGAFQGCTQLVSIDLGDNLETIEEWAFFNCSSLVSIVIPDSVEFLLANAFSGCTSLQNIYCESSREDAIWLDAFLSTDEGVALQEKIVWNYSQE